MFLEYICTADCKHDALEPTISNRHVQCPTCGFQADVQEILLNATQNPLQSANLAHGYMKWLAEKNGGVIIDEIPCVFSSYFGHNIYPYTLKTTVSHLMKGFEILRALNRPFTNAPSHEPNDRELFKNLMNEYVSLIDKLCSNVPSTAPQTADSNSKSPHEALALRVILDNMKNVFAEVDFFDQYFNILVPFVQSHKPGAMTWRPKIPPIAQFEYIGDALHNELQTATMIRKEFSKYCIPFDVVYVMSLCFICADNTDLVYNLVLDLSARLCTSYFRNNDKRKGNTDMRSMLQYLNQNVTPTQNLQLYYLWRNFRTGQTEDCFSSDFLNKFSELDQMCRTASKLDGDSKLDKFRYQQIFPFVLFDGRDEDYYGFVMALAYYSSKMTPHHHSHNVVRPVKGLTSECRRIYRFVKNCIERVRQFQRHYIHEGIFWTRDTFNVFLCSDARFEKELVGMLEMMLNQNPDDK